MKKESVITGVIGLLIGLVIAGFAAGQAVNRNHTGMMGMMGMDTRKTEKSSATGHDSMSMAAMTDEIKNKSGDEFDEAFLEMMIIHHEGALDMARLIPSRAKHHEIKTLGEAIITAQTKEIAEMKQWQKDWGYSGGETMRMMHYGQ